MALILSFTFILILCCASNINANNSGTISEQTLKEYENSTGTEKRNLETQIIETILNDVGRSEDISLAPTSELDITYGDVVGDNQQDIIFTVKIGPRISFVVVYEKVGDEYKFKALVDNFYEIQDIQVVPLSQNEKYIIMIRERVNQMVGAYEDAIFLRAYKWNETDNKFSLVLSIQENYKSYWNELWDNEKPKEESHWLSIKQQGKTTRQNNNYNTIYLKANQQFQQSNETNKLDRPEDSEFKTTKQRDITQAYTWNDKWQHYILGEGTEIHTGEKIAILQDLEQEPFNLYEEDKRYRIKHENGKIEFVDKNTINAN